MIKKQVFTGFIVGLIANSIGVLIGAFILSQFSETNDGVFDVIKASKSEGFLGKLLSLGAILNLIVFFLFLKQKQDYKARGVLLATVLVAIITFLIKL